MSDETRESFIRWWDSLASKDNWEPKSAAWAGYYQARQEDVDLVRDFLCSQQMFKEIKRIVTDNPEQAIPMIEYIADQGIRLGNKFGDVPIPRSYVGLYLFDKVVGPEILKWIEHEDELVVRRIWDSVRVAMIRS